MKYDQTKMTDQQLAGYYKALVVTTKAYGYCYVHAGCRAGATIDGVRYHIGGYGRSLQHKRGHKYKVYAIQEQEVLA
jgi:hypothetical protein